MLIKRHYAARFQAIRFSWRTTQPTSCADWPTLSPALLDQAIANRFVLSCDQFFYCFDSDAEEGQSVIPDIAKRVVPVLLQLRCG